jgi:glycosyltransferase involved in cell wall biosynthesis
MVGSAPWTRAQFKKKAVDVLLAAAQRSPRLHLVFLWRGVLAEEMERRVRRLNLDSQVDILNRKVDVNQVLAGVHASVSLATDPVIIRPYPHSLMESLVAGKPVIVSRSITMAGYVARTGCGKVVRHLGPATVVDAVDSLVREYADLQAAAMRVGQRDFSQRSMIASFQEVYADILEPGN